MATEHRATGSVGLVTRLRRHKYIGLAVNALPAGFWLTVFFLAPLAVMFYYSFGERGAFGEVLLGLEHIGLQQYTTFFIREGATIPETIWVTVAWMIGHFIPFVSNPAATMPTPYVQILVKSIYFGSLTTVISLLIGYPMAYYVARHANDRWQTTLIALVVLPYWASYLVRVYAIKILLAKNGLIDNLLTTLGIASNVRLLYTDFAVQFGLVYIWLPFMILPIYASLEQLNPELNEAAMDLGADRLDAFRYVTLPLSKPGVVAGSILVFIPAVGAYVIPDLLGGTSTATIGQFIANQFGASGNWPLGSAAAFILMIIMFGALWAYQRGTGGDML